MDEVTGVIAESPAVEEPQTMIDAEVKPLQDALVPDLSALDSEAEEEQRQIPYPRFKEVNDEKNRLRDELSQAIQALAKQPVQQAPPVQQVQPPPQVYTLNDFIEAYEDPVDGKLAYVAWINEQKIEELKREQAQERRERQETQKRDNIQRQFFAELSEIDSLPEVKQLPQTDKEKYIAELLKFNEDRISHGKPPVSFHDAHILMNADKAYLKGVQDGARQRLIKTKVPSLPSGGGTAPSKEVQPKTRQEAIDQAFREAGFD